MGSPDLAPPKLGASAAASQQIEVGSDECETSMVSPPSPMIERSEKSKDTSVRLSVSLYSVHDTRRDSMVFAHGESGILGGVFNYTNAIIGAGIISMPYGLYNCGLWLGIILLVVTGFFTALASHWIIKIGLKRKCYNYEDLCAQALGGKYSYLHCVYVLLFTMLGCSAYIMILGNCMQDVSVGLGASGVFATRWYYIVVLGICIMLPLGCFRDMHHLRHASTFSILIELFIMLLVIIYSRAYSLQEDNGITPFKEDRGRLGYFIGPHVFKGLSSFLFAFMGQHVSYEVFRSLKKPSFSSWRTVVNISVLITGCIATLLVVSSWLNLGDSIQANIMDTFGTHDKPTLIGKLLLAIMMMLTYPLDQFISRHQLNMAIFVHWMGKPEYMPFWRIFLLTSISFIVPMVIAIMFSDLGTLISICGAIGASSVGYITPSLLYLQTFKPEIKDAFRQSRLQGLYWFTMPMACLLFGLVCLFAGTVETILAM